MRKPLLFALFLVYGISIFTVPLLLSDPAESIYRIILCAIFSIGAASSRRKTNLAEYFPVLSVFFIASLVSLFEYFLYSNQSLLYWVSTSRMDLFVLFKVLSTFIVVIPIVLFTKATRKGMNSIYLAKGKLRLGLVVGTILFLFFLVTSVWTSTLLYAGKELTFGKVVDWAPWILVFVFSNGIKEEIQFRGLFLKKYEVFLGPSLSNLLQAIPFAFSHMGETYSSVIVAFIFIVFLLGMSFGAVAQKTNNLLASILFHAGSDIPVILGIFSNF